MPKQSLLYALAGLIVGGLLAGLTARAAVNNNHAGVMGLMGIRRFEQPVRETAPADSHSDTGMSMEAMISRLKGKTGDEFDKTFLVVMSEHHRGAIAMADLVKQNAKHEELKKMADDITTAQNREVEQMHDWMHDWDYE